MSEDAPTQRTRNADPFGKRALFSPPVSSDEDRQAATPSDTEGVRALYSAKPAGGPGTVTLECSRCQSHLHLTLVEAGVLILSFSLWIPGFRYNRWLRCPVCERRTWCRIHWIA